MLRMVNFVEHQLTRDGRLCTVYIGSTTLERWHHLLHHLIEEDVSELRVEERAELERDLRRKKEVVLDLTASCWHCCLKAKSPQDGIFQRALFVGNGPLSPQPKTWNNRINSSRHIWRVHCSYWSMSFNVAVSVLRATLIQTCMQPMLNSTFSKGRWSLRLKQCWHFWGLQH